MEESLTEILGEILEEILEEDVWSRRLSTRVILDPPGSEFDFLGAPCVDLNRLYKQNLSSEI